MIQGQTDNHLLQQQKVHIWDGNGTRHFLDQLGLTDRAEGDLGPIYGFQWRHFGATYVNSQTDYSGTRRRSVNEYYQRSRRIRNDRRLIMSAWERDGSALNGVTAVSCSLSVLCERRTSELSDVSALM